MHWSHKCLAEESDSWNPEHCSGDSYHLCVLYEQHISNISSCMQDCLKRKGQQQGIRLWWAGGVWAGFNRQHRPLRRLQSFAGISHNVRSVTEWPVTKELLNKMSTTQSALPIRKK